MKIISRTTLLCVILFANHVKAQKDCAPVVKLKSLYSQKKVFRQTIDDMLLNVHVLEDESPNPWKGKTVDDLYTFLNEWFYFLPNAHNGLDRILQFSFLYYKNPAGMKFILEEPGKSWSLFFVEERGKYMDSSESTKIIQQWLSDSTLNNAEFVSPKEGFSSFNDFFTRDLIPGARPVDHINDNAVLVSPADGVINMINNHLSLDSEIPTKSGMTLSLNALLDNSSYVQHFVGGTAMAVFLLPHNYHHYHAPVSGMVVESKESVGDRLFGMPDILDLINDGNVAYNKDYSVFENFRHGYFIIETEEFGYVAMIPIGLQTIGSVVFEEKFRAVTANNIVEVYKGDKLGHFAFGGSTVLLLFQKGKFSSLNVRQGQQIGVLSK